MTLTQSNNQLQKGDKAPEFNLLGTDDKIHRIKDESNKDYKAYLIVFMCNHCPYVKKQLSNLNQIYQDFLNIRLIGINSNDPDYEEEDNFENMKKLKENGTIKFTYLQDESQKTAKDYGASCTPDPFLFDEDLKLIWRGRIEELHMAIKEYLEKGNITIQENPSIGCSIKWKN